MGVFRFAVQYARGDYTCGELVNYGGGVFCGGLAGAINIKSCSLTTASRPGALQKTLQFGLLL